MDEGTNRAYSHGSVWLNDVFVPPRSRGSRLTRRSSIRVTPVQWFLMSLSFILLFFIAWGIFSLFVLIPGMDKFIIPPITALLFALPSGVLLGRKLSRLSPYRALTGEGMLSYLWVKADSNSWILGRIIGRTVATNPYITRIDGTERSIECQELIGTARLSSAPKKVDAHDDGVQEVIFAPRTAPTDWIKTSRRLRGRHRSDLV